MAWHGSRCGCCARSRGGYFATDAASRFDPSGTSGIMRSYEADLVRRMKRVRAQIWEAVVKNDVLGQGVQAKMFEASFAPAAIATDAAPSSLAFAFRRSSDKVAAFMAWLNQMVAQEVLNVTYGTPMQQAADTSWQNVYIQSAYAKGIADAAKQMGKAGASVAQSWVSAAFGRPIHADRIALIFTRAYADLQGITEAMATQISRTLAQGMAEGSGPMAMARKLVERVDKIGITRARTLARTEVMRAHADATLNGYKEAEVEGVNLMAEWATAGDNAVCEVCAPMEGKTYTIQQAEGLLPRHPNCRCAWIPVVLDPEGKVLT